MARTRSAFRCADCGHAQPRWTGRCPTCGAWGTLEQALLATANGSAEGKTSQAGPISRVPLGDVDRISTGIGEVDRVLGGGLVPGAVALVAGEPGIGKSTLLLQVAHSLATAGRPVLYVSGEESIGQMRLRAERLGALAERLLVASDTSLQTVLDLLATHRPAILLLDSIQAISDADVSSCPGSLTQVRECAAALVRSAKQTSTATL
ncbi:MAG: AAA family ATPase, partial [Actinomycetota bacterium]|nr:AAA family ATPase [Actinomycetota bacterium]